LNARRLVGIVTALALAIACGGETNNAWSQCEARTTADACKIGFDCEWLVAVSQVPQNFSADCAHAASANHVTNELTTTGCFKNLWHFDDVGPPDLGCQTDDDCPGSQHCIRTLFYLPNTSDICDVDGLCLDP
jgi:hypothetical protein